MGDGGEKDGGRIREWGRWDVDKEGTIYNRCMQGLRWIKEEDLEKGEMPHENAWKMMTKGGGGGCHISTHS